MRRVFLTVLGLVIGLGLIGLFSGPHDQGTPAPVPTSLARPQPTRAAAAISAIRAAAATSTRTPTLASVNRPTSGLAVASVGSAASMASAASQACDIQSITPDPENIKFWSPDGSKFFVSQKDANNVYQVYIGTADDPQLRCISCGDKPGGPLDHQSKLQPHWYPSGDWIIVGVEFPQHPKPLPIESLNEGLLISGGWLDVYATDVDGNNWFNLTNWDSKHTNGFTGVPFTPDGKIGVYARIVDNNIFQYPAGRWELYSVNFVVDASGVPSFQNTRNITPAGANWIEPGSFSADGRYLLISADIGLKTPEAQDQYLLDMQTGAVTNVTNSPDAWDEHGVFAPNGLILWMSSAPYPDSYKFIGLKTEFMIMNIDGSEPRQLTHFNASGYPESGYFDSTHGVSLAEFGWWSQDGSYVTVWQLLIGKDYPNHQTWRIQFRGNCGGDGALNS